MTFPRSQLLLESEPFWFCLKAQTKREHIAAAGLRQLGLECFAPRLRFQKMTRRGAIWFTEAMFPGYLFARFLFARDHRRVEHTNGIQRIVHFGEQIAVIDTATISFLQQTSGTNEIVIIDPEIKVGDSVVVTSGPLQGLEALVVTLLPAKERVRILLDFLGRSVATEIARPKIISTRGRN